MLEQAQKLSCFCEGDTHGRSQGCLELLMAAPVGVTAISALRPQAQLQQGREERFTRLWSEPNPLVRPPSESTMACDTLNGASFHTLCRRAPLVQVRTVTRTCKLSLANSLGTQGL